MNMMEPTSFQWILILALVVLVVGAIATARFVRRRRTSNLRDQFGGAEYDRALNESGGRRKAEAELDLRAARVDGFHLRPLAPADRTRFEKSWRTLEARFVESPAGSVAEADQLLRDVMSTRGYPVAEFDQRAADISVDHPVALANYRAAHDIALRQTNAQASTEELRQAMIHFRSLFEELVSESEAA